MANKKYTLTANYRRSGEKKWSTLETIMPLTPQDIEDLKHPEFWGRESNIRAMIFELIAFDPKATVKGGFVDIDDFTVAESKRTAGFK